LGIGDRRCRHHSGRLRNRRLSNRYWQLYSRRRGGSAVAGDRLPRRNHRIDLKLASALESIAQVLIFAAVAAPLSYAAASFALPLQDATFASMDRALGFKWNEVLAFMNRWPGLLLFMRAMYLSLTLQMTAVVLVLGFTGRLAWLRVYMPAFIFAALLTIALSALLSAEGAWLYYVLAGIAVAVVCLIAARRFVNRMIAMPVAADDCTQVEVGVTSIR
jgi:hypothetical protein